jgi:hypothetical protein
VPQEEDQHGPFARQQLFLLLYSPLAVTRRFSPLRCTTGYHNVAPRSIRRAPPAIRSCRDAISPGKPVIVGAGMRGDRASLIFSAPVELGRFIKA